jgi:hypothetical protein
MPAWLKPAVGVITAFGVACVGLLLSNWLAPSDVLLAVAVGVIAQLIVRGAFGIVVAFVLGIATLAVPIIYDAYFGPSVGGGASMWPLAILFSGPIFGSIAAVAAVIVGVTRGDLRQVKRHVP